jgi:acyl transferase domain-containing protein/acyl carrier protein
MSIAVVGMACRFPGAPDPEAFWNLLIEGRDAVTEVPEGRWSKSYYFHPSPGQAGRSYTWSAGVIGTLDRFDAEFFGIAPREAEQIDPQQRLLLELAWEAIESGGLRARDLSGSECGVYVGASASDYANIRLDDPSHANAYFMTGSTPSILSNRLSYIFNLRGPSFTVDTACSSTLVALDLACRDLIDGRASMAMVGAVNLLLSPYPFIGFCQAGMLSPTGRCHAFDARANGYVRAEGGAILVLKPLDAALAAGDPIRGVILGTGVNSDGRTVGLSLPNEAAQAALLQRVYGEAGVAPDRLAFIEAHGTGTMVGDPIEARAIGQSLGRGRTRALPIGSAKSNVGHLETAAGMVGLFKALLSLEHRLLPASIHLETPNPAIAFDDLNLCPADRILPLGDGPLVAGINSFGFGGTNGHAIVGSAPVRAPASAGETGVLPPLLVSARSESALVKLSESWAARLDAATAATAASLIRAAARRRDHHRYRLVARGRTNADLATALRAGTDGVVADSSVVGTGVGFVFSGNGAQWVGMGRREMQASADFGNAVETVSALLEPHLGRSVAQMLRDGVEAEAVARTDLAQPLLFAVQVGIVESLKAQGIEGSVFFGHSVGEIAAAWAAGALSLADASRVVAIRSALQHRTRGAGRMAVLRLSADLAAEVVARLDCGVEVAAHNSASVVTLAGPTEGLARVRQEAEREGWAFKALDLDYAFHTGAMDVFRADLGPALAGLHPCPSGDRFVSTVTGGSCAGTDLDSLYWWRNIRDPVCFAEALGSVIARGVRLFVEIGPHTILGSYLRDGLKAADVEGKVLATLNRTLGAGDPFPGLAASIHVAGGDLSGAASFDGPQAIDGLPRTPWQRERHWAARTCESIPLAMPVFDHPLLGYRRDPAHLHWTNFLDIKLHPWLVDHAVEGVPVMPAAGLAEIAFAAARATAPAATVLELSDLEIIRALPISEDQTREIRVSLAEDGGLRIESRARLGGDSWSLHAVARVGQGPVPATSQAPPAGKPLIEGASLYRLAAGLGMDYGPSFRLVTGVEVQGDSGALVRLMPPVTGVSDFLLHPASFDGALQGFLALLANRSPAGRGQGMLPSRIGRARMIAPFGRTPTLARLSVTRIGRRSAAADVDLFDESGQCVAVIEGCWFRRVQLSRRQRLEERSFRFDLAATGIEALSVPLDLAAILAEMAGPEAEPAAAGEEAGLLLEAFLTSAGYQALRDLTSPTAPGLIGYLGDLAGGGLITGDELPLFGTLLHLLADHGLAAETDGSWQLAARSDLPDPGVIWRSLLGERPDLGAELALAAGAVEGMADRLRGLVTTPPPGALVEHMRYASPSGTAATAAISRAVEALVRHWPAGKPLRIIELGAAGGVLTRRLAGVLARSGRSPLDTSYLATDPDPDAAGHLAALLGDGDRISAQCWTPGAGTPPSIAGGFDLVISLHGLTRIRPGEPELADLCRILAPGGLLLAAEPGPNPLWDVVFGGDAEWWQGTLDPAFPLSPMRDGDGWLGALAGSGWAETRSRRLVEGPWPIDIMMACRPAELRDIAPAPASDASALVIVAEPKDGLALALAARPVPPVHHAADIKSFAGTRGSGIDIVVLPTLASAAEALTRLTSIAKEASRVAESGAYPRLWIVTRGAHQALSDPGAAAIWGLGRTIANEMANLGCRLIDLPPEWAAARAADALAIELGALDGETEIVWTETGRHALRLVRGLPEVQVRPERAVLEVEHPGLLESLHWQEAPTAEPGPGQVRLKVAATGLNFRDVMWAMGLLPEEALMDGYAGPTLGLECAGTVEAVGEGVTTLRVGDRVAAFAPASLSSSVITDAVACVELPNGLGFEAAATVPVAYLTVVYALGRLAQLQAGETVLIHGGAGGVGLAAIQYAWSLGATVIATAGSPTKRAFLHRFGVEHVLDSRSLGFAEAVRGLTTGAGVDVVLNSLSGEAMERSLDLLRPFGRFIELGKRDFFLNSRVGLRPFRQNVSYFGVDADQLPRARPALAAEILAEVRDLLAAGTLKPLPWRTFRFSEAAEAFRLMQSAGHIGKIVLVPDSGGVPVRAAARETTLVLDPTATYLVTGGLAGFGLATARWLVSHGARHLALVGRRRVTEESESAVADMTEAGIAVGTFACDVADEAALARTLSTIRADMPPIKGIFHAAAVIEDGMIADLDAARFRRSLAAKLEGALNLDRLTRADPIALFVLYSSATTYLGAPGQGAYVAANTGLEALARRRRAEGLPALAVAWGPIADAGQLARASGTREALARRLAATPTGAFESLDALPALLASGVTVAAIASVRWDAARRHLPILASPSFAAFAAGRGEVGEIDLRERLVGLSHEASLDIVVQTLAEEVAKILVTGADRIDPHRPLTELGMDSLMAVELRLVLENRLGVEVPLLSLTEGTTLSSIAARVVTILRGESDSEAVLAETLATRYETADGLSVEARLEAVERAPREAAQ